MKHTLFYARVCLLLLMFTSAGKAQQLPAGDREKEVIIPISGAITDFSLVQRTKVYHALRTDQPIVIDGSLNESAWESAEVGGDFYQTDPQNGYPATEKTEFRILYDNKNLYVSVICYQQGPIKISELKREFAPLDGDQIVLYLDTFGDRKGGFAFHTNPGGAMRDAQIDSVGTPNEDWDGVFSVASRIQSPGWTTEFAIPFKTLRFDENKAAQRWGFNIQRITRHKNEWVQWSPAPRPFKVFEPSVAGVLDGIEGIHPGLNLYVKPFFLANYQPNISSGTQRRKKVDGGLDVKYSVTSHLTLDITANTDFSQVEADQQQVNLTRFSLFFPEKREFFLENLGLFDICSNVAGSGAGATPGNQNNGRCGAEKDIAPFFSRQIGLSPDGQPLPIRGGGRLTGSVAGFDAGFLDMKVGSQGSVAGNNWTVARLRHNVLKNSQIGGFLLNRQSDFAGNWNRSSGMDTSLNFLRRTLNISGFAMQSATPSKKDDNKAATLQSNYQSGIYAASSSYVHIGNNFQNDFGFAPRIGIRKVYNTASITPRPRSRYILENQTRVIFRHYLDPSNTLVTRFNAFFNTLTFRDGSNISIVKNMMFDRLYKPFEIRKGISIPVGDYHYNDWRFAYTSSKARRFYYNEVIRAGDFWSGTYSQPELGAGVRVNRNLQSSIQWDRNVVNLKEGKFKTDLIAFRIDAAFSPVMFLQSFIQYNTDARTLSSNIRYRFIHHPLSDFFIVYNDLRGIQGNTLNNRILSIKVTHLLSF